MACFIDTEKSINPTLIHDFLKTLGKIRKIESPKLLKGIKQNPVANTV